ncbi:hypothetical protein J6590_009502 [Homalodisca vitripennis]|nr:hypothetical protein J6590_009502 [Homalodisca vitripennis]
MLKLSKGFILGVIVAKFFLSLQTNKTSDSRNEDCDSSAVRLYTKRKVASPEDAGKAITILTLKVKYLLPPLQWLGVADTAVGECAGAGRSARARQSPATRPPSHIPAHVTRIYTYVSPTWALSSNSDKQQSNEQFVCGQQSMSNTLKPIALRSADEPPTDLRLVLHSCGDTTVASMSVICYRG